MSTLLGYMQVFAIKYIHEIEFEQDETSYVFLNKRAYIEKHYHSQNVLLQITGRVVDEVLSENFIVYVEESRCTVQSINVQWDFVFL